MNLRASSVLRFAAILAFPLLLAACAGDKDEPMPDRPVADLYNTASDLMDKKEFREAAKQFEEVERQHPYSQWATRAQLMEAFAFYQLMDYDSAKSALDQFIELHPGNANAPYAYYLRALCDYERLADVRRDQTFAQTALKELQDIVTRYPDTTYAKDALLKIALVQDHLAGAEMEIGRNYMREKVYTAAVGRFREVIEKYQTTSHVPEALHRLVECYLILGIPREAKATAAVLGANFPGSTWYQDSYRLLVDANMQPTEDKGSWIAQAWHAFF